MHPLNTKSPRSQDWITDKLPFDVLNLIFHLHATDSSWDITDYDTASTVGYQSRLAVGQNPLDSATVISHVCHTWRREILRMPTIWGRLMDTEYFRDSKEWWEEILRRAGPRAPLWLRCCRYPEWVENEINDSKPLTVSVSEFLVVDFILPVIGKHGHRVSRLHLAPGGSVEWGIGTGHWQGLSSLTNASCIILSAALPNALSRLATPFWTINDETRNLQKWTLNNCDALLPPFSKNLVVLHLFAIARPINAMFDMLRNAPFLRELVMECGDAISTQTVKAYDLDKVLPLSHFQPVELPHIRKIKMANMFPIPIMVLPRILFALTDQVLLDLFDDLKHFDFGGENSDLLAPRADIHAFTKVVKTLVRTNLSLAKDMSRSLDMILLEDVFNFRLDIDRFTTCGEARHLTERHQFVLCFQTEIARRRRVLPRWLTDPLYQQLLSPEALDGIQSVIIDSIDDACLNDHFTGEIFNFLTSVPSMTSLEAPIELFDAFNSCLPSIPRHYKTEIFSNLQELRFNSDEFSQINHPDDADTDCIASVVRFMHDNGAKLKTLFIDSYMFKDPSHPLILQGRIMQLLPAGSVLEVAVWDYDKC